MGALHSQPVVVFLEKLDLLQQGGVSQTQLLLIDFQHRQFAQRLTQLFSDVVGILLESVQQLLNIDTNVNVSSRSHTCLVSQLNQMFDWSHA